MSWRSPAGARDAVARGVINSSVSPSLRYCCAGSPVRFSKGSTASRMVWPRKMPASRSIAPRKTTPAPSASTISAAVAAVHRRRRSRYRQADHSDAGPLRTPSIARCASRPFGKRSAGFFRRHRSTTARSAIGAFAGHSSRSSVRIFANSSGTVDATNGGAPFTISQSRTPSAHTSLRASAVSPRICSGAIAYGVPAIAPSGTSEAIVVASAMSASPRRARPKSTIFTRSLGSTITLAAFRSRWTTPLSCA